MSRLPHQPMEGGNEARPASCSGEDVAVMMRANGRESCGDWMENSNNNNNTQIRRHAETEAILAGFSVRSDLPLFWRGVGGVGVGG